MAKVKHRPNPGVLPGQKSKQINSAVVKYTPEMARELLEGVTRNRYVSQKTVSRYADIMAAGEWHWDNGESIKIDSNGVLLDGQHRLHAVIAHGKPVRIYTTFNVNPASFALIDCGKGRRGGDICSIMGMAHYNTIAAALTLCYRAESGNVTSNRVPENSEFNGLNERYPDMLNSAKAIIGLRGKSSGMGAIFPVSVATYLHMEFARRDPGLSWDFWEGVYVGESLKHGTPVWKLRDMLLTDMLKKVKMDRLTKMALAIKAWNAIRTGSKVRSLRWIVNENFPEIK